MQKRTVSFLSSMFVLVGVLFGAASFAPSTNAAGLTSDQISAITSLLSSFDADENVIAHVGAVLSGADDRSAMTPSVQGGAPTVGTSTQPLPMRSGVSDAHMLPPQGIATSSCPVFARDLRVGVYGDDVRTLQDMLGQDPSLGFVGTSTGFFGPKTAQAVMRFQLKNNIASSSVGFVGPMTRSFFDHQCGQNAH